MDESYLSPTIRERKGTMFLRSNQNEYDLTKTFVSNWSQDAESYPKDYDVKKDRPWNLKRATYTHMSNMDLPDPMPEDYQWGKEGPMPRTTTDALYDDLLLAKFYVDTDNKPMQNSITSDSRLDGDLVRGVVGHKLINDREFRGVSTYMDDYASYNGAEWVPTKPTAEEIEKAQLAEKEHDMLVATANKTNMSQFTEKFFNKRVGRNTWQDETGVYGNALEKRLNFQQFNPLLNKFEP